MTEGKRIKGRKEGGEGEEEMKGKIGIKKIRKRGKVGVKELEKSGKKGETWGERRGQTGKDENIEGGMERTCMRGELKKKGEGWRGEGENSFMRASIGVF